MRLLEKGIVQEISMDHDLGLDQVDPDSYVLMGDEYMHAMFLAGRSEENGYHLACWMCETGNVPEKVTIHSWNPEGANNMAARFNHFGYDCIISVFDPKRTEY